MFEKSNKAVVVWLLVVASLVAVMVVVGGYVRLTHAGLSIVEWNPISGVIPPLGEQAWQQEFAKYQQTPEFKIVNSTMTIEGYQRIFYLEWAHRLIARIAGLIVVLPLAYFLWKGIIPWRKSGVYLFIALLFAFQGFLGWYMVSSGLEFAPQVSHYRLTIHLLAALLLLAITLWMALSLLSGPTDRARPHWSWLGLSALAIIVVQISYGGLVAGLKAGHIANTWPLMFGQLIPAGMLQVIEPWYLSLVEGPLTVHFIHRWLAFAVLAIALWLYFRPSIAAVRLVRNSAALLVAVVGLQILFGIGVVLFGVPLWLALLHQATALAMFAVAVYLNHSLAYGAPRAADPALSR